jgi:hypothetical protein
LGQPVLTGQAIVTSDGVDPQAVLDLNNPKSVAAAFDREAANARFAAFERNAASVHAAAIKRKPTVNRRTSDFDRRIMIDRQVSSDRQAAFDRQRHLVPEFQEAATFYADMAGRCGSWNANQFANGDCFGACGAHSFGLTRPDASGAGPSVFGTWPGFSAWPGFGAWPTFNAWPSDFGAGPSDFGAWPSNFAGQLPQSSPNPVNESLTFPKETHPAASTSLEDETAVSVGDGLLVVPAATGLTVAPATAQSSDPSKSQGLSGLEGQDLGTSSGLAESTFAIPLGIGGQKTSGEEDTVIAPEDLVDLGEALESAVSEYLRSCDPGRGLAAQL